MKIVPFKLANALNFENIKQPLATRKEFFTRTLKAISFSGIILSFALAVGVSGYHFLCGFEWVDSIYNSSMILTGMGPSKEIEGDVGKIFASCYALFSGLVFVITFGVTLSPLIHRVLHKMHIDDNDYTTTE